MPAAREVRKYLTFLLLIFIVFLDQGSKYIFLRFWPELVVRNKGIAFGMFPGDYWMFVSFLLIGIVFYVLLRRKLGRLGELGTIMIVGGGISNFIDRIIRDVVIDYIKIPLWPTTFNLADLAITLGIALFLWSQGLSIKTVK